MCSLDVSAIAGIQTGWIMAMLANDSIAPDSHFMGKEHLASQLKTNPSGTRQKNATVPCKSINTSRRKHFLRAECEPASPRMVAVSLWVPNAFVD
jgi:hypothetical protein